MRIIGTLAFNFAILAASFAVSCGDNGDSSPTPMSEAIELHVEAPEKATVGDSVDLRLIVANQSNAVAELSGALPYERYHFVISDSAGEQVWHSRFGQGVGDIAAPWTVAPKQEIVYEEVWSTERNDGDPVPPGTYFIRGTVSLVGPTAMSDPVEIEILP
jgi:hypothetical protein